jgi:hypothetical protein
MDAGIGTPSCGLFLTCRGVKYIQYFYNMQYAKFTTGILKM